MFWQLFFYLRNYDFVASQYYVLDAVGADHFFQSFNRLFDVLHSKVIDMPLEPHLRPAAFFVALHLVAFNLVFLFNPADTNGEKSSSIRVPEQHSIRRERVIQPDQRIYMWDGICDKLILFDWRL